MKIKFAKPKVDKEVLKVFKSVLNSGIFVHGKFTKIFEDNLKKYFKKESKIISTSSCTAAMHLFYLSINLKKGDEVIVSAQTHVATAHAVEICGAKPVFVDCELDTGNISINKIEKKITKKTKCIAVTHFLGKPANMLEIIRIAKKYKLKILEDTALSIGSKIKDKFAGTFGDAGAFSFHPVKIITTGEGGALILKNKNDYNYCKSIKSFGYDISDPSKRKIPGNYNVNKLGLNYRISEIESIIGISQLKNIKKKILVRSQNYNLLFKLLKNIKYFKILNSNSDKDYKSSYYCMNIILKSKSKEYRNKFILKLKELGIQTSIYYPHPVPLLKYYWKKYNYNKKEFQNATRIAYNSFSLPVGPHIKKKDIYFIVKSIKKILNLK